MSSQRIRLVSLAPPGTYRVSRRFPTRRTLEVPLNFRSHYLPRSRPGWISLLGFLGLMALAQPPIVFWVDARFGASWLLGMPFLYVYLGAVYFALIGVLLWALRRAV